MVFTTVGTGFGAVSSDVDTARQTSRTFYGLDDEPLGTYCVRIASIGNESLSFLGVKFDEAIVTRVRIVSGDSALEEGVTESWPANDLVVMDDLIFGALVLAALLDWLSMALRRFLMELHQRLILEHQLFLGSPGRFFCGTRGMARECGVLGGGKRAQCSSRAALD